MTYGFKREFAFALLVDTYRRNYLVGWNLRSQGEFQKQHGLYSELDFNDAPDEPYAKGLERNSL